MSTPAEEMRAAVTVLRCDHKFPMNRPPGSTDKPGVCIHCGVSWRYEKPVADWLVEPLAELLDETAHVMDCLGCRARPYKDGVVLSDDMGTPRSEWGRALTTARAITGGTP